MQAENVAFLLDSAPRIWCSQEDRHLEICKALIAKGGRPVLVFAKKLAPEVENRFREAGVEVAAISYANGAANYRKELKALIRNFRITTVHIIFFDYFSPISWVAKSAGAKYVIYEMQNGGIFRARGWKRIVLRIRNRVTTYPITKVIAISHFIKEQLIAGGVDEHKIIVRHLGIDTNRFAPDPDERRQLEEQYGIPSGELVLTTVSFLKPIKNPQTIVQACGLLKAQNVGAHLFVAGDGEMMDELQALSRKLGIEDRVHWLGLVADPTRLLQASDLFILATVGEAFGLVLAEAMACGVPVVGSRSGGIPEVVADHETGLLVPPLQPEALAKAIAHLGQDRALHAEYSSRGIQRVHAEFSMPTTVERTLHIYESVWSSTN